MGFSLNNLTLFGLVLAIGIVVDDAIVVVEAVEHHIENGMTPRDATIKAMSQVSGPVMAVGLVLSAVFVPCAFISGITGQFFRQFALTIAASTIISTFNSLTLSPALSAMLLRERDKETHEALPRLVFPLFGGWLGYPVVGAVAGAARGKTVAVVAGEHRPNKHRPWRVDRRRAGDWSVGLGRLARGEALRTDSCAGASTASTPDSASRPTRISASWE